MRALKTIVITLSVVLFAAFGLFIYGLSQNWHKATETPAASRPPATGGASWGSVTLGSAGERMTGVTSAGDLIVVQLTNEQGSRLLVVDPRTGRTVGSLVTGAQP